MRIGEQKRFFNQNQKELLIRKIQYTDEYNRVATVSYLAEIFGPLVGGVKERLQYNENARYPHSLVKLFLDNKI